MARVATVDFTQHVLNDTFTTRRFNFFESDGTTPLDLTDATPRVQIRRDNEKGKLMKTCTVGDGLTWNDQAQGQLDWGGFVLSWSKAGDYYYDVQLTYATSSVVRTYVKGVIKVINDVTVG